MQAGSGLIDLAPRGQRFLKKRATLARGGRRLPRLLGPWHAQRGSPCTSFYPGRTRGGHAPRSGLSAPNSGAAGTAVDQGERALGGVHHVLVVRCKDHNVDLASMVAHQGEHKRPAFGVKFGGWLVGEQDLGCSGPCPRHATRYR